MAKNSFKLDHPLGLCFYSFVSTFLVCTRKKIAFFFYMFGDVWTEDYDSRVSCVYRFGDLGFVVDYDF